MLGARDRHDENLFPPLNHAGRDRMRDAAGRLRHWGLVEPLLVRRRRVRRDIANTRGASADRVRWDDAGALQLLLSGAAGANGFDEWRLHGREPAGPAA